MQQIVVNSNLNVWFSHEVQVQSEVVLFQRSSTCSVLVTACYVCHRINDECLAFHKIFNRWLLDVRCFIASVNFDGATNRMAG